MQRLEESATLPLCHRLSKTYDLTLSFLPAAHSLLPAVLEGVISSAARGSRLKATAGVRQLLEQPEQLEELPLEVGTVLQSVLRAHDQLHWGSS